MSGKREGGWNSDVLIGGDIDSVVFSVWVEMFDNRNYIARPAPLCLPSIRPWGMVMAWMRGNVGARAAYTHPYLLIGCHQESVSSINGILPTERGEEEEE